MRPAVYIISNYTRTVLYVCVTSSLVKHIYQHREGGVDGFSRRYKCKYLLYYELAEGMETAIMREKQIKSYRREKKDRLIAHINQELKDLYDFICGAVI